MRRYAVSEECRFRGCALQMKLKALCFRVVHSYVRTCVTGRIIVHSVLGLACYRLLVLMHAAYRFSACLVTHVCSRCAV